MLHYPNVNYAHSIDTEALCTPADTGKCSTAGNFLHSGKVDRTQLWRTRRYNRLHIRSICKFADLKRTFAIRHGDPVFSGGHPVSVLTDEVGNGAAIREREVLHARYGARPGERILVQYSRTGPSVLEATYFELHSLRELSTGRGYSMHGLFSNWHCGPVKSPGQLH